MAQWKAHTGITIMEKIDNWTEVLLNPQSIKSVYGENIPSTLNIELVDTVFEYYDSFVDIRIDLNEFPEIIPLRWLHHNYSIVQLKLRFYSVDELNFKWSGKKISCSINFFKVGDIFNVYIKGDEIDLIVKCHFIKVLNISGYCV